MSTILPVRFRCSQCQKRLRAKSELRGQELICPNCKDFTTVLLKGLAPSNLPVPVQQPLPLLAAPLKLDTVPPGEPTVPLSLSFPKGAGGVQTTVTQKTADDCAKFAVGGLLVAVGMVVLMILTGGRFKPSS
jgi:phage FluMu protein Com